MVVHQTHKESDSCTWAEERETMNKLRSFRGNPIDPNIPGMSPWGEGEGSTTYNISSTNCQFPGKTWSFRDIFWRDIMFKMFSEAAELCWKTDHLTKSLSCFIVRSHVGVKCVIYCASFWRVHNFGDRPRCVKNERRKRETWTKREELEVKKCMRRDFCARRERGVRKIVIWHPRWVNMRIEFGNFVTHQGGFFFI